MSKTDNHFPFTEAKLRALPSPATGRAWWYDTKASGLCLCKTAAGTSSFYFYRWVNGKPNRKLLGKFPALTVDQARRAAQARIGTIAAGGDPDATSRNRQTLQHLFDHWLTYARAHKKASSVTGDEWLYKRYLAPWAARRLSAIKRSDVQELHARLGRENGIYAANRMLALLRAMFNKADEIGYRSDNPAAKVKAFKEQSRDRFLHPDELQAFFAALNAEEPLFRDFFLICLLTGARKSNVLTMQWADVDLTSGYWRIPETKGGQVVVVPLIAPALDILRRRREEANGSPWVFPGHRHGDRLKNPDKAWDRVLKTAGLTDLRMHDLRRSLGSWMAGQNTSLTIIGKVLGHRTPQATAVYARLSLDPLREAVDRAATAMLTAGGQQALLAAPQKEGGDNGEA